MIKDHLKKYFEETSLHGLKYITEDGRHAMERALWVFLCCAGFCLAIYFMKPSKACYKHIIVFMRSRY